MAIALSGQQNYPNGSANIQFMALKQSLDRPEAYERISVACDERFLDVNSNDSVSLRRWITPSVDGIPEIEGITPASQAQQFEDFTGTMKRYSQLYAASTVDRVLNPYAIVPAMVETVKIARGMTREKIRWNAALSGTNVIYNSSAIAARANVNGPITLGRLQVAIRGIEASKGRTFNDGGMGSTKIGTTPVEAGFYCFVSTNAHSDIRALPGFVPMRLMTGTYPTGTFGSVQNIIFITSPEFTPYAGAGAATSTMLATSGNTDVYPYVLVAQGALVSIALRGKGAGGMGNADIDVLDGKDKSDPTNARVVVSTAWFDLCILASNDWDVRIECGVTANPA